MQTTPDRPAAPPRYPERARPSRVAAAVLAGSLAVVATWWAVGTSLSHGGMHDAAEAMTSHVRSWGALGAVASICLMVAHGFVPFPAEILAVANCVVFGPVVGFVVTWTGAMIGAALSFALTRRFGRPLAGRLLSRGAVSRIDAWTGRAGTAALLIGRLVPLISFNAMNYAAGLSNVSWWTFMWTTGVGIVPAIAATMWLTDGVGGGGIDPWYAVPAGAACLGSWWWWRRRAATRRAESRRHDHAGVTSTSFREGDRVP